MPHIFIDYKEMALEGVFSKNFEYECTSMSKLENTTKYGSGL